MGLNGNGSAKTVAGDGRLRSWKEIASYFGADERTVKRWEVSCGLPVHRVPGQARAPVYAYEGELSAWLRADPVAAAATPVASPPATSAVPWRAILLAVAATLVALAVISALGWQRAARERQVADDRVADVRQLARSQVAALSDRLEKQPGTVRLRAGLALEAAAMLSKVAALPDATPELRQEAAEAYRRLAIVQNSTERPSLRDRPAARASLARALRLVNSDATPSGRWLAARILVDAARQAAADGAVAAAPAMLTQARAKAAGGPLSLQADLLLGAAEIAVWQGDYARALKLVSQVPPGAGDDREAVLRRLRGLDTAAEAQFYAGDTSAALAGYRRIGFETAAAQARWPGDPRFRWMLQRQQWNFGTTLNDQGRSVDALGPLRASRDGWLAMAERDPEDEAVASWVRTARESYGEALAHAGRTDAAIDELSLSLSSRRAWLAGLPASAERRRALIVGLTPLADALAMAGRRGEACALYGEATAMAQRMAASGNLTALDRDSLLKQLHTSAKRNCPEIDAGRPLA